MMAEFTIDAPNVMVRHNDNPIDLHYSRTVGAYSIPPFLISGKKEIIRTDEDLAKISSTQGDSRILYSVMPLWAKRSSVMSWWLFPIEPIVSVSCTNKIIRREVAKSIDVGTIKERWSQDDWRISISGTLIGLDGSYPDKDIRDMITLFSAGESVDVRSKFLEAIGITSIVIESIDLPATKGLDAQNYTLSGYSDKLSQLLIEV